MISKNIKKIREARGFSQDKLADMVHYKQQQVSNWERGLRTPSIDDLLSVAKALEVPVGDLLYEHCGLDWYECTFDEKEKKYIFKIDNTEQILKSCESEDYFTRVTAIHYLKMKGGKAYYSVLLDVYGYRLYYNLLSEGVRLNVDDFARIYSEGKFQKYCELDYKQQLISKGKKMIRRMVKYKKNKN